MQMLELHTTNIPTDSDYRNLLPFLLQPAVWHQQSRIPGQVAAVLFIIQQ